MFNYKIDESLLPNVWVTWKTTKNGMFNGRYWLNCKTGEKTDKPESWMHYPNETGFEKWNWNHDGRIGVDYRNQNNHNIWVKNGCKLKYAYMKYHPDIDMLEMAAIEIPTTRAEEPHHWKYMGDRVFLNRNKEIFDINGKKQYRHILFDYHYAYNLKQVLSILTRLNSNDEMLNEFKKFIGKEYFVIGNGRCVSVKYLYDIQTWAATVQKGRSKGKKQTDLDKLVAMPLNDVPYLYIHDKYKVGRDVATNIAYFQHINDDLGVIRMFTGMANDNPTENYRMYVRSNGKHQIASLTDNGWVPASKVFRNYGETYAFVNKTEANKNKQMQYAIEAIDTFGDDNFVRYLIKTLNTPEVEQFVKLGCEPVARTILNSTTHKEELKQWFGGYYNERAKSILNRVGLTKAQLDIYMQKAKANNNHRPYGFNYQKGMRVMRYVFGNDLRHLDNQSFERYIEGFTQLDTNWVSITRKIETYLPTVDGPRFLKNAVRIGEKRHQAYSLIRDTLDMVSRDNQTPEFDWYFDDYSDIVRIHDVLTELHNEREARRRALWDMSYAERLRKEDEYREKLDKKRKEYEYEDDEYIIRLPKSVQEIVDEGTKQNICIGGYTARHATGETNLFFLRKKNDAETPFYAIEMNNNSIVQIHGFGNKWLGNDPEAIPTVVRWLRKHSIRCDETILTCTARGYCRNNEYIQMPVVD